MRFLVRCRICSDVEEWIEGEDDPDTNSLELDGGLSCGHDEFDITDTDYGSPIEGDVI